MAQIKIISVGDAFGLLTVIATDMRDTKGIRSSLCTCLCGNEKLVRNYHLAAGNIRSCGCKKGSVPNHGHALASGKSRTYTSWAHMKQRCNNPNDADWAEYGGRGISICSQWDSFKVFLADMGSVPSGMTLDRIDNSKGYEPSNCRWATSTMQARNRRRRRYIVAPQPLRDIEKALLEVLR